MLAILLQTLVALSSISCFHASTKDKPDFIPYCTTRDKCKAACSCQEKPNCTVLDFDDKMRNTVLLYHNQIREIQSRGEPVPGGMTMLQYDNDLEQISRCWAARCEEEYSECFITPKFNETSQASVQINVGCQEPKVTMFMQGMSYWLGQAKVISAETLSDIPTGEEGEKIHNFAQLLSDRIKYVGCAWSKNDELITFVCTYGPRGPIPGEPIFKIGPVCTMCPENYGCDELKPFNRLCKEHPVIKTTITPPPSLPPMPPTLPATSPPEPPPKPPTTTTSHPVTIPPSMPPFQTQPVIIPLPQSPPALPTTARTYSTGSPPLLFPQPPPFIGSPKIEVQAPPPSILQAPVPMMPQIPSYPVYSEQDPTIQSGPPPPMPHQGSTVAYSSFPLPPQFPSNVIGSSLPEIPQMPRKHQMLPQISAGPPPIPPRISRLDDPEMDSFLQQSRVSERERHHTPYGSRGSLRHRTVDGFPYQPEEIRNYGDIQNHQRFPPINLQSQTHVPTRLPPLPKMDDEPPLRPPPLPEQ